MKGTILTDGYVIFKPKANEYFTANKGLYKTKEYPTKYCEHHNKVFGTNWRVLKVKLEVTEDD